MRYGTVCSGIEACSAAWHPLGWTPVFFSEIAPFQSALLSHYYPEVPNLGDFTTIAQTKADQRRYAVDVLCGGTPCQSYSVAGKRAGIHSPNGNLALEFFALVDRLRPTWFIWENVPGVHSSKHRGGRDTDPDGHGADLYDFQIILDAIQECRYGACWRVLDARFFGVPQRRRRVFVVGHIGGWRGAAAVLFEREMLRGDYSAGGEAGEEIAGTLGGGSGQRGRRNDLDTQAYTVCHSLTAGGHDASEDGTGRGSPIVCDLRNITSAANRSNPQPGDPCHTLATGADAMVFQSCVFTAEGDDVTFTASNGTKGVNNQTPRVVSGSPVYALGSHASAADGETTNNSHPGGGPVGMGISENLTQTLRSSQSQKIASANVSPRRLTPLEWERCFGFPDHYTAIPYRGKPAADAPRYQALGNSMAVPVMQWIGRRIELVDEILRAAA